MCMRLATFFCGHGVMPMLRVLMITTSKPLWANCKTLTTLGRLVQDQIFCIQRVEQQRILHMVAWGRLHLSLNWGLRFTKIVTHSTERFCHKICQLSRTPQRFQALLSDCPKAPILPKLSCRVRLLRDLVRLPSKQLPVMLLWRDPVTPVLGNL